MTNISEKEINLYDIVATLGEIIAAVSLFIVPYALVDILSKLLGGAL